jgi:NADH-quinone oxidoreductase subunit L
VLNAFWLIPLLPLLGFLINGLGIKWMPRKLAGYLACATVGAAFLVALGAFLGLRSLPVAERSITHVLFPWITSGSFSVNVAFLWDPLSAVMAMVVSGVGFLIHIYSIGYMAHDPGYKRYFTYLNLFTFAMLTLVLADNFLLLFVGWEGVGLCSYLLIGFWYEKDSASDAGKKAFIVNRIGDFGVLVAMFLVFWTLGSLTFSEVFHKAPLVFAVGSALPTTIALLFFLGATGKSAQLPLYVWLPDAMEGPTPVSALIHAATMVTAGVYLFARASGMFMLAPNALMVVGIVGALTAIFAATIGLVQNDIKRVLAYSTVSQLGYMFLAVGSGAFVAAIFHLMTHAFFKALLFLGSGSVIEACHHEQDMRKMGGLGQKLPITRNTFIIGSLALAGVPIFAGFFSKDEILFNAFTSGTLGPVMGKVLWVVGAAAALLTAFYITRAVAMTFYGQPRDRHIFENAKESPAVMTVPLMILAVLSTVGGFLGLPLVQRLNAMHNWLSPVVGAHAAVGGSGAEAAVGHGAQAMAEHGAEAGQAAVETGHAVAEHAAGHSLTLELVLMAFSVALAIIGIWWGWQTYVVKPGRAKAMGARFATMYRILLNKYYVDEFYHAAVVRPLVAFSRALWKGFDVEVIDGIVNGSGKAMRGIGRSLRPIQSGLTGNYAAAIMVGAIIIMSYVLFGGGR